MSFDAEQLRRRLARKPGTSDSLANESRPGSMHLAATRASLLTRLKDPGDESGWQRFFDTYAALIHNCALKAGCSATEADDVLQEVLLSVAREIPTFKYDPAKGSFKSWLFRIVSRRVVDLFRRRRVGDARRLDTATHSEDAERTDPIMDAVWEEEWKEHVLGRAVERVRAKVSAGQWQMFELSTLQEWPMEQITTFLGVNRAQVYMAKMRVSRMLKQAMIEVAEEPG
jgi:RNA polymerase sigma-70 factor (ECF subfamily)